MTEHINFYRLIKLLLQAGKTAFVRLIERYVSRRRPDDAFSSAEWTIDHFLHENIQRITSTYTGQRRAMQFFPGFMKTTHLAAWDMQMLCFVLREICHELPSNVLQSIDEFRKLRDNLCYRADCMSNEEFQQRLNDVQELLIELAKYSDVNVQQSNERITLEIESSRTSNVYDAEAKTLFTELVEWHCDEKDHRDRLKFVPKELIQIRDRVQELVNFPSANKAVPPRDLTHPKIPVTRISLLPNCETPLQTEIVSRRLEKAFQNECKENDDVVDKEVKNVKEKLKSENLTLTSVARGCIELHIQSLDIAVFTKLIEDCVSGKLNEIFKPIEEAVRKLEGFEEYTQEVLLYKDEFDKCMAELANNIDDFIAENEMSVDACSQRHIPIDQNLMIPCGMITLTVESNNTEGAQIFKRFNEDGRLHRTFEGLSTILNKAFETDDISLEVTMDPFQNTGSEQEETTLPVEQSRLTLQAEQSGTALQAEQSGTTLQAEKSGNTLQAEQSKATLQAEQSGTTLQAEQSGATLQSEQSGTTLQAEQSGTTLQAEQSGTTLQAEQSGTTLQAEQSGATLQSEQSGTTLQAEQSGTTLQAEQSGTTLQAEQSGTTLQAEQSGTSLQAEQSGTTLQAEQSGNTLQAEQSGTTLQVEQSKTSLQAEQSQATHPAKQKQHIWVRVTLHS